MMLNNSLKKKIIRKNILDMQKYYFLEARVKLT